VTKASLGVGLAFFAFGTSLTAYWVIRHGALSKDLRPVLRIHDILVWIRIRIRGSLHLTIMDPDPEPDPAIFVIDFQDANIKLILKKVFLLITF
jgi:hypothetical protein